MLANGDLTEFTSAVSNPEISGGTLKALLSKAALRGNMEAARTLLSLRGEDIVNAGRADQPFSPLLVACDNDNEEMVELLLEEVELDWVTADNAIEKAVAVGNCKILQVGIAWCSQLE